MAALFRPGSRARPAFPVSTICQHLAEALHRRSLKPPAAVFALLTDPEKILRWMGTEAQVEPQPGGLISSMLPSDSLH